MSCHGMFANNPCTKASHAVRSRSPELEQQDTICQRRHENLVIDVRNQISIRNSLKDVLSLSFKAQLKHKQEDILLMHDKHRGVYLIYWTIK
jgi:hypothetical protein